MAELDVRGYLARLALDDPGPPSVPGLYALHQAHVERVPYENVDIQLGRPTTVDPYEAADRVVRLRRGGYCYHVNGAFAALLDALGYDVRWHVGGVQNHSDPGPVGALGNHLALTVHGLTAPECPDGVWLVDAGLGDGLYEPLPLVPGVYRQGPFAYRLAPSVSVAAGWRFDHDPSGSFAGMDFGPTVAVQADFAAQHHRLSNDPASGFVRVFAVYRRDATGVDCLKGCVLQRTGRPDVSLATKGDWYAALHDVFGMPLDDVPADERDRLWRKVRLAHEAWARSR